MNVISVEVLNPYTLRPVKVYKYEYEYDLDLILISGTFINFLDGGGGYYRDGKVYRYLYNYEGIPRKTTAELVASVTKGYQEV